MFFILFDFQFDFSPVDKIHRNHIQWTKDLINGHIYEKNYEIYLKNLVVENVIRY